MTKNGFTLIEVSAALVIISIALTAIMGMYSIAVRSSFNNKQQVIAFNLLQSKLEEINFMPYATDPTINDYSYAGYPDYAIDINQITNYFGNPNLKRVDVAISWMNPFNVVHTETVATLKAND